MSSKKLTKKQFVAAVVAACKVKDPDEEHKNGYKNVAEFMIDEGGLKPSMSVKRARDIVLEWCNDCAA